MTVREAIVQVLKGATKPLQTGEILERILAEGLYEFNTEQPSSIVSKRLRRHCLDIPIDDASSYKIFIENPVGYYSMLKTPVVQDLESGRITSSDFEPIEKAYDPEIQIVEEHARYVKELKRSVLAELKVVSPRQFETFGKRLIEAYGFSEVQNTRFSGDGGFDGSGKLRVGMGVIRCAFECKRWSEGTIGEPQIRGFVGGITGEFHQGIYFTTSTFTKAAISFAEEKPIIPIILVPGEEIVEIMMHKGLGLKRKSELPIFSNQINEFFSRYLEQ